MSGIAAAPLTPCNLQYYPGSNPHSPLGDDCISSSSHCHCVGSCISLKDSGTRLDSYYGYEFCRKLGNVGVNFYSAGEFAENDCLWKFYYWCALKGGILRSSFFFLGLSLLILTLLWSDIAGFSEQELIEWGGKSEIEE